MTSSLSDLSVERWRSFIRSRLIVLSPLGVPSPAVVKAAQLAGYDAIIDLGEGKPSRQSSALSALKSLRLYSGLGVRISMSGGRAAWRAHQINEWVAQGVINRVMIDEAEDWGAWGALRSVEPSLEVWVEARTLKGARRAAQDSRINGVVLVAEEAAGSSGDRSVFMWLQLAEELGLGSGKALTGQQAKPFWMRGGMTTSAMAASLLVGAEGLIVDEHLVGSAEFDCPLELDQIKEKISRQHSERRLVSSPHYSAAIQVSTPREGIETRYARLLVWPGSFGWDVSRSLSSDQEPLVGPWGDRLGEQFIPLSGAWSQVRRPLVRLQTQLPLSKPRCSEVLDRLVDLVVERITSSAESRSPLCPPSGMSDTFGIRYPLFQGPMTRVSDTPHFAQAVAQEGGLPFLALSLLSPDKARRLLEETRSLLGEVPWGIGILGFSPPELRAAHLSLIEEFHPAAVLIAGGRPSQSRALEEKGIPTFLHAPAPELLKSFIDEGARRFVFEGSECGGYIGPTSSLTLWDAQLDVMLQSPHCDELSVLFAGGIHDACSAGIVSVITSSLVSKGADVGVLMGTGYLFTEEAVTTGAILPSYQQVAFDLTETETLTTAPGHITRCAPTPFVEEFEAFRTERTREGVTGRELWHELEQLNVGRLRVASKGLRRKGDQLEEVDEQERLHEGMYMIGEVASLRHEPITIRALHDQVALESEDWVRDQFELLGQAMEGASKEAKASKIHEEIAIVGMACLFPDAQSTDEFWYNISEGIDSITEVPQDRWSTDLYYDPDAPAGERSASKWGGFLKPVPFDPMRYGIPPQTMVSVEPVQLLALEVAARALTDAGYSPFAQSELPVRALPRERTSVIFGAEAGTDLASAYTFRAAHPQWLGQLPPDLDAVLPKLNEDSFAGVLANVISGRIANRLNLGGANFTVDAACASSLAALDAAVKSLRLEESDVVICGGADLHNSLNDYLMFSSVHALSKTGRCRPFDQSADGIALGEGVAALVLKRKSDAERDGDRVYAVVSSIAASSDGRALGLTAPLAAGQKRALTRAYERAQVSPGELGLVEAHGTGTVVGDRTELSALTELYLSHDAEVGQCTLGSVKSQIGHTKCAAGMAGLIKVALSIYYRTRPRTLHIEQPNQAYLAEESPFCFEVSSRPWVGPTDKRRGAVSAFGFGGTNYHAVLSEAEGACESRRAPTIWTSEAIPLRGENVAEARLLAGELSRVLLSRLSQSIAFPLSLADLARSALDMAEGLRPNSQTTWAVILASDLTTAQQGLNAFALGEDHASLISLRTEQHLVPSRDQIAFLFPGQGAQKVGMMSELFLAFPSLAERLELHPKLAQLIFPPAPSSREAKRKQQSRLTDTRIAQPALGLCDVAMFELLSSLGVRAGHFAGHSYGELVALTAVGIIPEGELIQVSTRRGELIYEATGVLEQDSDKTEQGERPSGDPGAMAAITGGAEAVGKVLAAHPELEGVVIANMNSPKQTVISGPTERVHEAIKVLKAEKLRGRLIPVACAFHSPLVAAAAPRFSHLLRQVSLRSEILKSSQVKVWSNQTAKSYTPLGGDEPTIAERLGNHLSSPVRFVEQIENMIAEGVRVFVEVGPGRILSGLVEQIVKYLEIEDTIHVIPCAPKNGNLLELTSALAELDCLTGTVDWYQYLDVRGAKIRSLQELDMAYPAQLLWWVNGMRSWPDRGDPPRNALGPAPTPLQATDQKNTSLQRSHHEEILMNDQSKLDTPPPYPVAHSGERASEVAMAAKSYFESMRSLAEAQERVMLALLNHSGSDDALNLGTNRTVTKDHKTEVPLVQHRDLSSLSDEVADFWGTAHQGRSLETGTRSHQIDHRPTALESSSHSTVKQPEEDLALQGDLTVEADKQDVGDLLVELVSERTGYPVEMLDVNLDLEADLSVDSIKRIEILGALAEKMGLTEESEEKRDAMIEELAVLKTLGEMTEWLRSTQVNSTEDSQDEQADRPQPDVHLKDMPPKSEGERVPCAWRRWAPSPLPMNVLSYDDEELDQVFVIDTSSHHFKADQSDGVIELFSILQKELRQNRSHPLALLIIVPPITSVDIAFTFGGVSGLLKTLFREASLKGEATYVRSLELSPDQEKTSIDEIISAERVDLLMKVKSAAPNCLEVIKYRGEEERLIEQYDEVTAPHAQSLELSTVKAGVTLATGGARGVTARCLVRSVGPGHTLLLCGRTPHPNTMNDEERNLAYQAHAETELRGLIARHLGGSLSDVGRKAKRLWAQREVEEQLERLTEQGAKVIYLMFDLQKGSTGELLKLLEDTLHPLGLTSESIETVIHGAGLIDDQRIVDKSKERFAQVYDVKAGSASRLFSALPTVKNWIFFSSVSAALGNDGQADYAAANATLDQVAERLCEALHPSGEKYRAVSIQWGPWAGAGMVNDTLARLYASRGVKLLSLSEGVELFTKVWMNLQETIHIQREDAVLLASWPFYLPSTRPGS